MVGQRLDLTRYLRLVRWSSTLILTLNTKPIACFFYHSVTLNWVAVDTCFLSDALFDHRPKMLDDNLV